MGAWALYGLGSESQRPARLRRVQLRHERAQRRRQLLGQRLSAHASIRACSSAAAATRCSTCPIRQASIAELQRDSLDALKELNQLGLNATGDPEIATRINSFEMAFRMQGGAPELMDIAQRAAKRRSTCTAPSPASRRSPTTACWPAAWSSAACASCSSITKPGTSTANLVKRPAEELPRHRPGRSRADQGSEAARPARRHAGHLGRRIRPHADGSGRRRRPRPSSQRLHHVAGRRRHQSRSHASARPTSSASTSSKDQVHVHDLHATILHLLGFDHTKLTYSFQGRNFRLTDVHGNVVPQLIA